MKRNKHWDQIQWTSNKFAHPAHDDERHYKKHNSSVATHKSNSSSSSSGGGGGGGSSTLLCICSYKTDFSVAQTTPQSSSCILFLYSILATKNE